MIRAAPFCFAASTPISPTAPSPTTTAVPPSLTCAASAAYRAGAEDVRGGKRARDGSSGGSSSVATSVPSASGTRAYGACAPVT